MIKSTYETLKESFEQIVSNSELIAKDFMKYLKDTKTNSVNDTEYYNDTVFSNFRVRGNSELLSVAFFGAFSSGKSALISGLSSTIEVSNHGIKDEYIPLLPSAPQHTSSCPVAVEPQSNRSGKNQFWVKFEGSEIWESKITNLAIMQAYVTDLTNARKFRDSADRNRNVICAKIGLASPKLNARFYDLPGFGAIGVNYESTIKNFVQQSDCIVYVAWAVRPLDDKDLELLRSIYDHHKTTGKPVFFVLTQIDRALDSDGGFDSYSQWEITQKHNNEFLEAYFTTIEGRPDMAFIGEGFIPVSAFLEAKGISIEENSKTDSQNYIKESRMEHLRKKFIDYLKSTSGPIHLVKLVSELQRTSSRMYQDLLILRDSESTPINAIQNTINGLRAQKKTLIEGKDLLKRKLENLGQTAIKRAFAKNDADDLSDLLTTKLNEKISKSNLLNEKEVHKIETEKSEIVRFWLNSGDSCILKRWEKAWTSYIEQAEELTIELIQKSHEDKQKELDVKPDKADLAAAKSEDRVKLMLGENSKPQTIKDTLEILSTSWKACTFIATIGASGVAGSALGITSLAALGPIGWAVMGTAAIGGFYAKWRQSRENSKIIKELLNDMPNYSRRVIDSYQVQATEYVNNQIGLVIEEIDNEIERTEMSIKSLSNRLATNEFQNMEDKVKRLNKMISDFDLLLNKIKLFYSSASESSSQPHLKIMVQSLI